MDHDQNSSNSRDDPRSSTVITVAKRVASFSSVVDELVVRVYSFMRFDGESSTSMDLCLTEIGPVLVLEADAWWIDHGLGHLSDEQSRELIREMLSRAPMDGALLSLGVFARERYRLLEREDVDVMHSWCIQLASAHRKIALALAGVVMARWYAVGPEGELEQYLVAQFERGVLPAWGTALAVCLGLLQTGTASQAKLIMNVLSSQKAKVAIAGVDPLGGLLGKLWEFLPAEVEAWLGENSRFMSRKVFRLTVERMPSHIRSVLTQAWKAQRAARNPDGGS